MKKRALIVLFFACILLGATGLTEYLFYRQDEAVWVQNFENRLHKQEKWADDILKSFRDSVQIEQEDCEKDVIFLGFHEGKLFFWTDELMGDKELYRLLTQSGNFVKLGNTYYEVRHKCYNVQDYFALLRIKDAYPYNSKYVKDKFGSFLKIAEENASLVEILPAGVAGAHLIRDNNKVPLFSLIYDKAYKEQGANYVLIILYLISFLCLFHVYDALLKVTVSWKKQLLIFVGFVVLLGSIRGFMLHYEIPSCIYRLPIFMDHVSEGLLVTSIGDLLLSTFCIFNVIYITFYNIKINYGNELFRRYRYLIACLLLFAIFLYVDFYNFAIDLVVANMSVHLNVAQLIHVGVASIIAFIAISLGGLVILYGIFGSVFFLHHFLSFKSMMRITTLVCLVLWGVSDLLELYTNFWDCFFIWGITMIVTANKYLLKRDIQQSVYMLGIFLLSVYIVMITKKYEHYKEQRQRLEYATELIEERDYNFEKYLVELNHTICSSTVLAFWAELGNDVQAEMFLQTNLLDMKGYNYYSDITFCREGDRLVLADKGNQCDCRAYFDQIIKSAGYRLGQTNFYAIRVFDGFVTYIGRFHFGDVDLFLRFDAEKDEGGIGYPQILSRKSGIVNDPVYTYSYAKYLKGELVSSSGEFVYGKKLKHWGGNKGTGVLMVDKDYYSHMLVAVDDYNTLIISLPERMFALYYMNALYTFLVCMLLASYGLFFNFNNNSAFSKGTLKARIKNSVISLIFLLLVLLTALSIFINTKSFEGRHKAKAIEFLKYVNRELEQLDCVDRMQCPDIVNTLSNMSELLMIDINIYSLDGELVATSRPDIFELDFRGSLINPRALQAINKQGATSYIEREDIGELNYMAAYMPLVLDNGKTYILNVPYFAQNDELNLDIIIMVVITVNIAIIMMVVAFVLSGLLAERVTKPLKLVNDKLRKMRIGGKNEKISYKDKDELGVLVQEYNNMVDKLEESISQLARTERESAWREMARQIAHEIKNPLTPMKLNIQFMLRSLQMEDTEKFKQRFKDLSAMLMEQIDNMAATASTFSDFAKMSVTHNEVLKLDEVLRNCSLLFENTIATIHYDAESNLNVYADREQMRRVIVNLLKNAEQSIPVERQGEVWITLKGIGERVEIRIKDNGCGIPEDIQKKIFEPNFTTKSSGSGLGLAICRRIIENFGGEIGFTTTLGVGTEFYIIMNKYDAQDKD